MAIIVTSGKRFTDIDALACVIAYREIDPNNIKAVLTGPLNQSVPQTIRRWPLNYQKRHQAFADDKYIIVDVSEDDQLPEFVNIKQVIEIYDHHFGFEVIWTTRPWIKTQIEEIGACATLIWEEIKKRRSVIGNQLSEFTNNSINQSTNQLVSPIAANLLYTAIGSNTLYFKSRLTTERDIKAFKEIEPLTDLPDDWIPKYYREIESFVYEQPQEAIRSDTKIANLNGQTLAIGQMELWLSEDFIKQNKNEIAAALRTYETELWLFTSPCIGKGFNYLYTQSQAVKEWLKIHLGAVFDRNSDIGTTQRLWLRKEVLRELQKMG